MNAFKATGIVIGFVLLILALNLGFGWFNVFNDDQLLGLYFIDLGMGTSGIPSRYLDSSESALNYSIQYNKCGSK